MVLKVTTRGSVRGIVKGYQGLLEMITRDYQSYMYQEVPEENRNYQGFLGLLEITRDYQGLLQITRDYYGLLEITRDYYKLLGITRDYQKLLGITRDYQRLLGITADK